MGRKHLLVSLIVLILGLVMIVAGCSGDGISPGPSTISPRQATANVSVPVAPDATETAVPTVTLLPRPSQPPVASLVPTTSAATAPVPPDCNMEHSTQGWGTEKKVIGSEPPDPGPGPHIAEVEYARHPCDDWFVVRIPADVEVDVILKYTDEIKEDPTGDPIHLVGGAKLHLVIGIHGEEWAPRRHSLHGPAHFEQWGAIRDIQFAGTFEGLTSFAIGVVERNAFTVLSEYWGGMRRIIVKIAH